MYVCVPMKVSALWHRSIESPLEPDTYSSFLKWVLETKLASFGKYQMLLTS